MTAQVIVMMVILLGMLARLVYVQHERRTQEKRANDWADMWLKEAQDRVRWESISNKNERTIAMLRNSNRSLRQQRDSARRALAMHVARANGMSIAEFKEAETFHTV